MEYPFGHHHRSHHRRDDDDDDDEYPPPPPPSRPSTDPYFRPPSSYDPSPYDQPPPPAPHNYGSYYEPPPPPPHDNYGSYYEPPPPPHQRRPTEVTGVYHSSYASDESPNYPPPSSYPQHTSPAPHVEEQEHHHSYRPHVPSFIQTHIHTGHVHENPGSEIASKPSVRVYSKAETNHSLAIRDGQVILARSDPNDLSQHWVKDEKYSIRVKDEEGFPCFALVNKATGQAMKHSVGATYPVQLITYNPDVLDESVLWTLSRDLGDGYRTIRMVNNIRLNVDAFNGDKNHGGVHDGTTIVLWEWLQGENQRWKIVPHCE